MGNTPVVQCVVSWLLYNQNFGKAKWNIFTLSVEILRFGQQACTRIRDCRVHQDVNKAL